jgi:hypothetical protein
MFEGNDKLVLAHNHVAESLNHGAHDLDQSLQQRLGDKHWRSHVAGSMKMHH